MRAADAARAVLGTALVLRPATATAALGTVPTAASDTAGRVLGVRWLVQAAYGVVADRGEPAQRCRAAVADAVVEALHAASMVALAATSPRWARPAAASAAVAATFAVADVRHSRDARRSVG